VLEQAVLNLCLNARDAMPNGGKITIGTSVVDLDENSPFVHPDLAVDPGQYVRIRVADNGIGIAPENLDKIFDPFFTTKEVGKGSGLGLAMVYGIVQNSRGYVHVESKEGMGTVFDLFFRVASGKETDSTLGRLKPGLKGDETILLVDDEPLVRDLGSEILRGFGYRTFQASDGLEAIDIYEKKGSEIDLVILDLLMPNLSGNETFKRLRHLDPNVKILICSGYSSRENDPDANDRRQAPLVHKPFKPEELGYAVRRALDEERRTSGKVLSFHR